MRENYIKLFKEDCRYRKTCPDEFGDKKFNWFDRDWVFMSLDIGRAEASELLDSLVKDRYLEWDGGCFYKFTDKAFLELGEDIILEAFDGLESG
jgi:hypothetical protein